MNEIELGERLAAYRAETENAEPPLGLTETIAMTTARRARTRRFVRDARAGVAVAAVLGSTSGLWALGQSLQVERDVYVLVSLWSEGL
jgi:hypothetical protein